MMWRGLSLVTDGTMLWVENTREVALGRGLSSVWGLSSVRW